MKDNFLVINFKIIFFLISIFIVSCSTSSHNIKVLIDKNIKIYAGEKVKIKIKLLNKGKIVKNIDTHKKLTISALKGKILNNEIYINEKPGIDILTISYLPFNFKEKIKIKILNKPSLIIKPLIKELKVKDTISFKVYLKEENNNEKNITSQVKFFAQLGKFNKNIYKAPNNIGKDKIQVVYKDNLKKEFDINIVPKPHLVVKIEKNELYINENTKFHIYIKKGEKLEKLPLEKCNISCKYGKIKGNIYYPPNIGGKEDKLIISIPSLKEKKVISLKIKDLYSLDVKISNKKIKSYEEIPITPYLYKNKKRVKNINLEDFIFIASKGKFKKNVYIAPLKGKDKIEVIYKPLNLKKELNIEIEYSNYRKISNPNFEIEIPIDWQIIKQPSGIRALNPKLKGEINCVVFPGLDFLSSDTLKMIYQQQKNEKFEEIDDEKITIDSVQGKKIKYLDKKKGRILWCIILKHNSNAYILTFSGFSSIFKNPKIVPYILESFRLKRSKVYDSKSLILPKTLVKVEGKNFSIKLPEGWEISKPSSYLLVGISKVVYKNNRCVILVISYVKQELKNLDVPILTMFLKEELIKDPTLTFIKEKDINLQNIKGKFIIFEGGKKIKKRLGLIVLKKDISAYVIIFSAPLLIIEKNSEFPDNVIKSFKIK